MLIITCENNGNLNLVYSNADNLTSTSSNLFVQSRPKMGTNTTLSTAQGYLKLLMRKRDPHGNRNVSRIKHWPKPPKTKKYKST